MKARDIVDLLAKKHEADVFVSECKNGPTWGGGRNGSHVRLDAWAMKRSWAHPATFGYEIKVSRSDFLKDGKWPAYMQYCSEFYFVCTHGLIQPEELPADVGLLWVAKTGTRLFSKRKAVHRDVDIPEALFRYVLMSRAAITGYDILEGANQGKRAYWERWLEKREVDGEFGRSLGKTIRETVTKRILEVESENDRLTLRMETYDRIRRAIERLGMDPEHPSTWGVEAKIREAREGVTPDLKQSIQRAMDELRILQVRLEKLEQKAAA